MRIFFIVVNARLYFFSTRIWLHIYYCRMASPVFVWPLHLLGGVYADLHAGRPLSRGFEMMHTNLEEDGVRGDKVTLYFDFESPLGPNGRINVTATGGRFVGVAEAERSAVQSMVEAIRREDHVFPADYNYVVIVEKRALYDAMKSALMNFRASYVAMEFSLRKSHAGIVSLCRKVSSWLGRGHVPIGVQETIAVSAFHASMADVAIDVDHDLAHVAALVDMIINRDAEPEERRHLDQTMPMPMVNTFRDF